MAFTGTAGTAGFVLELDKSQLDRGLPEAERQFDRATSNMAASASRAGVNASRGLDGLLTSVRGMRTEAEELERRAASLGGGLDTAGAAAGRAGAGFGALAGRVGLIGTAVVTGMQALDELSDLLDTTGRDAYTAEGRLRNLGSALAQGDIVGGIKALAAQPRTLRDLGLDARGAAAHLDDLKAASDTLGGNFTKIYQEAKLAAQGIAELDAASQNLLRTSLGLRDAQGNLVIGGTPGQQFGVAGEPPVPSFGTPIPPGATRLQELRLRLAAAQRADDKQLQEKIQKEIVGIYQNRVDTTKLTGQALFRFRQELSQELTVLDGIQDRIDTDEAAAAEKRRQAAEAADRERQRKAEEAARERKRKQEEAARSAQRAAEELAAARKRAGELVARTLTPGPYANTSADFSSAGVEPGLAKRPGEDKKDEGEAFTMADLRRIQFEFLTSLQGITNQFGSNVTADGAQTATNTWQTAKLTEKLVTSVDRLAGGVAHPGAKYARIELMEPYGAAGMV